VQAVSDAGKPSGRLQLLLVAAVFIVPLLLATWLYYRGGSLQPQARANHGALLEPIVDVDDVLADSDILTLHEDRWLLVYPHQGACEEECRDGLYSIRQMRLMLGREMDRVTRVFLHGDIAPDTVFLGSEHEGLVALEDGELSALLAARRPPAEPEGGYYLVDPQGNLVMYFAPTLAPRDIVADLKRLLKLSHIG
jgi:hypothetical protein